MQFADPIFGWFLSWGNEDHNGIQELVAVSEIWTFLICLLYFCRLGELWTNFCAVQASAPREGYSRKGWGDWWFYSSYGRRIIGFNPLILVSRLAPILLFDICRLLVKILSICKCSGCCSMPWFKCNHHLSSRSSKSRTMFLRSAFSADVFFTSVLESCFIFFVDLFMKFVLLAL